MTSSDHSAHPSPEHGPEHGPAHGPDYGPDHREFASQIETLPPELFPTFPLCWATLSDIDTEDALEELEDWISWLVERYALDHRTVPPCWEHHGALVEELSALRTAWVTAFNITGRPEAPLEWHAQFALARHRLSDWASRTGCRTEHRPDHAVLPGARGGS